MGLCVNEPATGPPGSIDFTCIANGETESHEAGRSLLQVNRRRAVLSDETCGDFHKTVTVIVWKPKRKVVSGGGAAQPISVISGIFPHHSLRTHSRNFPLAQYPESMALLALNM